jgi:hypothetical protein
MAMVPDNVKELTLGNFRKKCLRAQCPILPVEAYTSNANLAEGNIRELKQLFCREMDSKHIPEGVWNDCLVWCAKTRLSSCLNLSQLQGQTPLTHMTGETYHIYVSLPVMRLSGSYLLKRPRPIKLNTWDGTCDLQRQLVKRCVQLYWTTSLTTLTGPQSFHCRR